MKTFSRVHQLFLDIKRAETCYLYLFHKGSHMLTKINHDEKSRHTLESLQMRWEIRVKL